jgi:hypothetical protein
MSDALDTIDEEQAEHGKLSDYSRHQVTLYLNPSIAAEVASVFSGQTNETILCEFIRYYLGNTVLPEFDPRNSTPKRRTLTRKPRQPTGEGRRSNRPGKIAISAWLPHALVEAMLSLAYTEEKRMSPMLVEACMNILEEKRRET